MYRAERHYCKTSGQLTAWLAARLAVVAFAGSLHAADPPPTAPTSARGVPQSESLAPSIENKLDPQIVLALKQSRGEPPFDKASAVQPDIPIRDGPRVLVDVTATVSEDLQKHVAAIGGRFAPSPDSTGVVRALIPLTELEALASRADVMFVAPARIYRIGRIEHDPKSPGGFSPTKP